MTHATGRKAWRGWRRPGLRTLFAAYVLAPLGLVAVGAMWLGARTLERVVQQRLEEDVQLVARSIQVPLSRALAEGEAEQLYEALGAAFRIRRVYGAYVYDAEGRLVAEVGLPAGGAAGPAPGRVAESGRRGEYGEVGGRRVYSYFVPLTSAGERIEGLLQVTRRRSDMEAVLGRVRLQAAGLFGGAWLVIAVLVLVAHQRAVGRHFGRLSAAMARVERGERGARISEDGPREVAEIAAGFNRMVTGVEGAERELESRRRREAELQEQLRRTEKLAAIGRLAAGVAHELGTPLSVVSGTAQRLAREAGGAESGDPGEAESGDPGEAAVAIRREVHRMERIVRQLLEFGTRATGERQRAVADWLVVSAAGAVRGEAEALGVQLDVEASSEAVEVVGDTRRLEAALMHLMRNAIQAAGRRGRVRSMVRTSARRVEFVVDDSGPGVAEEMVGRLFEPFFTTKPVGEGSGLGLAVVHAVAEEHGGGVVLSSSPLGGARFILWLPWEPAKARGPVGAAGGAGAADG